MKKISKIIDYLHYLASLVSFPRYKMNIFSGTNSIKENVEVLRSLFLNSKNLICGSDIMDYENLFQKKFLLNSILSFASARMALYTALKGMGIKQNDEIVIPSFTCAVVPNAIIYSGAHPIYCEVNPNDFNVNIKAMEKAITKRTKALYAQHTFGNMCDIEEIIKLGKKYNIPVIEDVALALGAKRNGRYAGSFGDIAIFSTDKTKTINTGFGGMLAINNRSFVKGIKEKYETVPYLSSVISNRIAMNFIINNILFHPRIYWIGKLILEILYKFSFSFWFNDECSREIPHGAYSYPARLPNILASIGINQLHKLEQNLINRKRIALKYNDILSIYNDHYMDDPSNTFLRYSFLIRNRVCWEKELSRYIDLSIWFKTIACGRNDRFDEIYYQTGSNRISEFITKHIINFPTIPSINVDKIKNQLIQIRRSGDIISVNQVHSMIKQ